MYQLGLEGLQVSKSANLLTYLAGESSNKTVDFTMATTKH